MKATVFSHDNIIGTTNLTVGDETMGCVYGEFIPNENYFKEVQKSVWEFWASSKPDYEKWHALRLNVQLENEYFLFPRGGYTISDSPDFPDEPKRIDIAGIDLRVLNYSPHQMLGPWGTIHILQKLAFENELKKEVTPDKSFFHFLNLQDKHSLAHAEASAIAKFGPNDDVLFEVNVPGNDNSFAVVHLTWTHQKEAWPHFPATQFYRDFDDFSERRMKSDNLESDE